AAQRADRPDAQSRQLAEGLGIEAQGCRRQRIEGASLAAAGDDRAGGRCEARQGPGRRCRAGDRRASGDAAALQPREQVLAQARLAAMQMRRPGDVEQQPVGAVDRDIGRIAFGPARQPVEEGAVGGGIVGQGHEPGHARSGIGKAKAGAKA
ncbi:MAG: hypothetical protein ACK56I_19445, partial [bacterium]